MSTAPSYKHILFFIILIDGISFGLIVPIIIPLLTNAPQYLLGEHPTVFAQNFTYSLLMALFPVGALLGSLCLGRLSDHFGRKKILLIGLGGTLLSYLILSLSLILGKVYLLLFGRFLSGFAALGNRPIAQAAMADMSEPHDRALNMSYIALAMTLAMAAGPLLGGLLSFPSLIQGAGRVFPMILTGILAVINMLLLYRYFPGDTVPLVPFPPVTTRISNASSFYWLFSFFFLEAGWSLYFQAMPLIMSIQFDYGSFQLGSFLSFMGLCMCFGLTTIFRWSAKRCSLKEVGLWSFLACISCLMISVIGIKQVIVQWIAVIPLSVGVGLAYTIIVTRLSELSPSTSQGAVMGMTGAIMAAAWCLSAFLITPLMGYNFILINVIAGFLFIIAQWFYQKGIDSNL